MDSEATITTCSLVPLQRSHKARVHRLELHRSCNDTAIIELHDPACFAIV